MRRPGLALVVILIGCGNGAPGRKDAVDKPASEQQAALKQAKQAQEDAVRQARSKLDTAQGKLHQAAKDLEGLDGRVQQVQDALVRSRTDADRAAVDAQLTALRKDKLEFDARLAAAQAEAAEAARAMLHALEPAAR
jgi:chromosome segregation ATPase